MTSAELLLWFARRIWWSGRFPSRSRIAWGGWPARWVETLYRCASQWSAATQNVWAQMYIDFSLQLLIKENNCIQLYLLFTFLAVISIAAIQDLTPDELIERDLQTLTGRHPQIQSHERLLALIPTNRNQTPTQATVFKKTTWKRCIWNDMWVSKQWLL